MQDEYFSRADSQLPQLVLHNNIDADNNSVDYIEESEKTNNNEDSIFPENNSHQ